MKYVLLVRTESNDGLGAETETEARVETAANVDPEAEMAEYVALKNDLIEQGIWLGGQALHGESMATRVRVRAGETLVVDGPLAETGEQIIGYYLLDCRDLDEAVSVAARVPGARRGAVDVRPVWDYEAEVDRP